MSFKDKFLATRPGPAREALIYNEVISMGPPKNLVPVTIDGPGGSKITYRVMPDYLMIEGIRVPMTGVTAQRIANHFGMTLPTTKMEKQIWDAADTKIPPKPMSAGGVIGGKYYTGQEVVNSKINTSDTSVAFNDKLNKELEGKNPTLVAGHMKSIVQPEDPNRLGITGWRFSNGEPIQKGNISMHDIDQHSEYASGTRLVSDEVEVKLPDGKVVKTTMDKLLSDPTLYKAVSQSKGLKKYVSKKDSSKEAIKEEKPQEQKAQEQPKESKPESKVVLEQPSVKLDFLKRIENFLNQFSL
jgi:hypothetical protein